MTHSNTDMYVLFLLKISQFSSFSFVAMNKIQKKQ